MSLAIKLPTVTDSKMDLKGSLQANLVLMNKTLFDLRQPYTSVTNMGMLVRR